MFEIVLRHFPVANLFFKHGKRAIGVELNSKGEAQFLRNFIGEYSGRNPKDLIWIFHDEDTVKEGDQIFPDVAGKVFHAPSSVIRFPWFRLLDIFITAEQFYTGPPGVYTITLFHGQPSKGVTFGYTQFDALKANDAFFLYGPLQRDALNEYLKNTQQDLPKHISLFEVGYTKSDPLLRGDFNRDDYLIKLGLNLEHKTILYAPAFNEGASMRESGMQILEILCQMEGFNVLAKLAIDCWAPIDSDYATGGVNWIEFLGLLESRFKNFRLIRELEADRSLAASDILVTCVSSIGFEFLALGRPVIFIDTPKFFSHYLKNLFPGVNTELWSERTTVNGGREFGTLVKDYRDLPQAIKASLSVAADPEKHKKVLDYLLFNPGIASEVAVDVVDDLLLRRVKSARSKKSVKHLIEAKFTLRSRMSVGIKRFIKIHLKKFLNERGFDLIKTNNQFIDAKATIAAARKMGLTVCEYREEMESDPRKKGRRDYIIDKLRSMNIFEGVSNICEIGAGTGMYLERILKFAPPNTYEVYETALDWRKFLEAEYGDHKNTNLVCHSADGATLCFTGRNSVDIVHCHGVFVYLPLLHTFQYLQEAVRVCCAGGYIIFDCFTDDMFSDLTQATAWLRSGHMFPVVIPQALLRDFKERNDLISIMEFDVIYGAGHVRYFVWRKN